MLKKQNWIFRIPLRFSPDACRKSQPIKVASDWQPVKICRKRREESKIVCSILFHFGYARGKQVWGILIFECEDSLWNEETCTSRTVCVVAISSVIRADLPNRRDVNGVGKVPKVYWVRFEPEPVAKGHYWQAGTAFWGRGIWIFVVC